MIKHFFIIITSVALLSACRTTVDTPPTKSEPRLLVTPELLKGKKFGYSTPNFDVTYYHLVDFQTDSTGYILLGGDVLEACKYRTQADSIYVTINNTEPPYTEVFGYKNETLIDRRGNIWTPKEN